MLPKIMPSRLQRIVNDVESGEQFTSFNDMCKAVADTGWAKTLELDAATVAKLIAHHGTTTIATVAMPASFVTTDTVEAATKLAEVPVVKAEVPVVKAEVPVVKAEVPVVKAEVPVVKAEVPVEVPADAEAKIVKTYDEGGKGKKPCPSCKKYVGLRVAVCACGHQFVSKAKVDKVVEADAAEPQSEEPKPARRQSQGGSRMRIHTPAGACPHRLDSSDEQAVEQWAERVRKTFMDRDGSWLTVAALKYFVHEFYDMHDPVRGENPEYRKVCNIIESLYSGEDRQAAEY
jgi:hypothetical protein